MKIVDVRALGASLSAATSGGSRSPCGRPRTVMHWRACGTRSGSRSRPARTTPRCTVTRLAAGAVDVLQPSVTKVGGLGETKKIATLAAAANVTLVPHACYFGLRLAASLHFAASTPGIAYVEFPPGELEAPLLAQPIRCVGGDITVGDSPGLGADPDPDVLARFPYSGECARPFYLV